MKRTLLLLLAFVVIACQTITEIRTKDCTQVYQEIVAAQTAAGRVLLESETDESGQGLVYWDHVSTTAYMEFFVAPDFAVLPEYGMTYVEDCLVPSKTEGVPPSVWKYYKKTIPVKL